MKNLFYQRLYTESLQEWLELSKLSMEVYGKTKNKLFFEASLTFYKKAQNVKDKLKNI